MTLEKYSSIMQPKIGGVNMRFSLKELRARKNETQPETASAIGISTQTYCAWEKNLSNVSISKVAALCKHFGVTLDEIQYE